MGAMQGILKREQINAKHVKMGALVPKVQEQMLLVADLVNEGLEERALNVCKECIRSLSNGPSEGSLEVVLVYENVVRILQRQGNIETALTILDKITEIEKSILGKDHPSVATTYCDIAALLQQVRRYDDALNLYRNALAIYKKSLGKNHSDVASVYNNIAVVHHKQRAYEEALASYAKAKDVYEKSFHPDLVVTYQNMGIANHSLHKLNNALSFYNKALVIRSSTLGADHEVTKMLQHDIDMCRSFMDTDSDCETEVDDGGSV